jgi:hypothetical protein
MGEDAEIEAPLYPITAHNNNSVHPSFNEFVIQYDLPLRMHEFPMTKGHEYVAWGLFPCHLLNSKIFE